MATLPVDILSTLPLRTPTPQAWVDLVTGNFDRFLADHAACERKAHAAAMMLVNRFPDYPALRDMMTRLAQEEQEHFQQVSYLLNKRGIRLPPDEVDVYVKNLLSHVRHPRREHLLDRLLVAALVEARSCERFCLIAIAFPPGQFKDFYTNFATAEGRHYLLFIDAARQISSREHTNERLSELLIIESNIMTQVPLRPTVH
jgi:tRNA-(ms[2]io[6]A)-hydroxylase